jgi:hypothetical protein
MSKPIKSGGELFIVDNSTDLERACPGVSRDMIRLRLRDLKSAGRIECLGRGPGAKWRKRVIPSKEGNKEGNNSKIKR